MGQRQTLHQILNSFTDYVYFQPPPNITLKYPCIIYERDFSVTHFADDKPYSRKKRYMVTIVDQNPDSDIPEKVAEMPMSSFNRFYAVDSLNHDVYTVYF